MGQLQVARVSLSYGPRELLKGVSVAVGPGSKIALTGDNGSGKTTLMKIMAGLIQPESGQIAMQKETTVAYLPQSGVAHEELTLFDELEAAFSEWERRAAEKRAIEERLAGAARTDGETRMLLERQHELEERLLDSGYYRRDEAKERVLDGLGFARSDFLRRTDEFSGGRQMRIALAKVLLERPDVMLLDEPTNYLDLEARNWLEDYLAKYHGGYLIVSHDRYFLDTSVNQVAELFNGALRLYRGNYSAYLERRSAELESLVAAHEAQQEEIAKIEDFIRRFRYNASKAAMVQSRIKQLERIRRIEIPESLKRIHFTFPPAPHSARAVVTLDGVSRSYGANRVLTEVSVTIERGEKVVLAGKNGAGKSTLMRIVAGVDTGFHGSIAYGQGVACGYYAQDVDDLRPERTVLEEMEQGAPTDRVPDLRNLLGAFLFRGDDVHKSVSVLSGGERSRLALLKLLLRPANLLVLDEPTNHLDMASKNVLLDALQRYSGTLVFVSHDRYFIDELATKVLELKDARWAVYPGDYRYYLYRVEQQQAPETPTPKPVVTTITVTEGRRLHAELKVRKSRLKSLSKRAEELVAAIDTLENEHRSIMEKMSMRDVYLSPERIRALRAAMEENESRQKTASAEWHEVEEELGRLRIAAERG